MPEPVTIFTITLSIIGFFNTIRTGIQTIYDDTKSWKRFRQDLDGFRVNLHSREDFIATWKDKWMVWNEDEDEEFYEYLWGKGWTLIRDSLKQINSIFKGIDKAIKPLLKKSKPNWIVKLQYIFKQKDIKSELANLIQQVDSLGDMATRKFSDLHGNQEIHHIGNRRKLIRLAMQTSEISDSLYQTCLPAANHLVIDLELDLFNTSDTQPRSQAISTSEKAKILNFAFLAKAQRRPDDLFVRTRVHNKPDLRNEECQISFQRAFTKYTHTRQPSGFTTSTHRFCVQDGSQETDKQSISFRTLLRDPQHHGSIAANLQSNAPKIKMAFELAEFVLLLLRTAWIEGLCSCMVHRRRPSPDIENFYLRVGHVQHLDPQQATNAPGNPWCKSSVASSLVGLQLRYLGILLTEIAIGSPILDVQPLVTSGSGGPAQIQLVFMTTGTPPRLQPELLQDTLDRVRAATREVYVEAVKYCLKSSWTRNDIQEEQLEEYYWSVLVP